jgi:hypothetical protein
MIEIGPNLKDFLLVGIGIIAFAWVMVTAFKNM